MIGECAYLLKVATNIAGVLWVSRDDDGGRAAGIYLCPSAEHPQASERYSVDCGVFQFGII